MKELSGIVPVAFMCRHFDVSRSGFYASRPVRSQHSRTRRDFLKNEIKRLFETSKGTYGSPRIFHDLSGKGIPCSENTVAELMRKMGLCADLKKKFKVMTTDSNHQDPIAPRLFKTEDYNVKGPNEIWAGDITYIRHGNKFIYLSVVLDLYTRKVVGWSIKENLHTQGVTDALQMAFDREGSTAGIIFHSDRGIQFASQQFRDFLTGKKALPSMSRKGNCYDNAFVESFFKSLKSELIYRENFENEQDLRSAIFEYIETWYNRKRLHSSLGYLSPVEYEKKIKQAA
jgi:putative transposase